MKALAPYRAKRDFGKTPEPEGIDVGHGGTFVVQKHAARALHYDFRLEHDGVLLSWAVPKGPSLDPKIKRLAMQVEDHPIEYAQFEGAIPEGQYGGGTVIVWDHGRWQPEGNVEQMLDKGHIRFRLDGQKLHGGFTLLRAGKADKQGRKRWLLIKRADEDARAGAREDIVVAAPSSVLSGRSIEDVRRAPERTWSSKQTQQADDSKRAADVEAVAALLARSGAPRAALPSFLAPQLALASKRAPEGPAWFNEIKLDGYRIAARLHDGQVRLFSRRGNDWTARLPSIARACQSLPIGEGLVDGEVVVFDEQGKTDFQRLQNSLDVGKDEACAYVAFDLPFAAGYDLRGLPLSERKAILQRLLSANTDRRLRFSEHVVGHCPQFLEKACELGLEGVIAKRADSQYRSDRGGSWLKCKCSQLQEFVIAGYTEPAGTRTHFGALLLGLHTEAGLRYVGKVGTGFSEQSLARLTKLLQPLERKDCPFASARGLPRGVVHWVQPRLVAQVRFAERTAAGLLRQASFVGLRDDKVGSEVSEEPSIRQRLTHPSRVLFPQAGLTKLDLATHYARVAPFMLPHLVGRPLMVLRCPEGVGTECFFQKHPSRGMPAAITSVSVPERAGPKQHLCIENLEGLLGLVQLGALEVHSWSCQASELQCPDRLIFDLDPDTALPWARIVEAALLLKETLSRRGLVPFVKTTGGKGLHVVTAIRPDQPWERTKQFCKDVVSELASKEPDKYLLTMAKDKRQGRIFLDYLRNTRGATSVCAYSTRAVPGAWVSMPISWQQLQDGALPQHFDVKTVATRLAHPYDDPWAELASSAVALDLGSARGAEASTLRSSQLRGH